MRCWLQTEARNAGSQRNLVLMGPKAPPVIPPAEEAVPNLEQPEPEPEPSIPACRICEAGPPGIEAGTYCKGCGIEVHLEYSELPELFKQCVGRVGALALWRAPFSRRTSGTRFSSTRRTQLGVQKRSQKNCRRSQNGRRMIGMQRRQALAALPPESDGTTGGSASASSRGGAGKDDQ